MVEAGGWWNPRFGPMKQLSIREPLMEAAFLVTKHITFQLLLHTFVSFRESITILTITVLFLLKHIIYKYIMYTQDHKKHIHISKSYPNHIQIIISKSSYPNHIQLISNSHPNHEMFWGTCWMNMGHDGNLPILCTMAPWHHGIMATWHWPQGFQKIGPGCSPSSCQLSKNLSGQMK